MIERVAAAFCIRYDKCCYHFLFIIQWYNIKASLLLKQFISNWIQLWIHSLLLMICIDRDLIFYLNKQIMYVIWGIQNGEIQAGGMVAYPFLSVVFWSVFWYRQVVCRMRLCSGRHKEQYPVHPRFPPRPYPYHVLSVTTFNKKEPCAQNGNIINLDWRFW